MASRQREYDASRAASAAQSNAASAIAAAVAAAVAAATAAAAPKSSDGSETQFWGPAGAGWSCWFDTSVAAHPSA